MADGERASRLDGETPCADGAELADRRPDVILLADGNAAGGQHEIVTFAGSRQGGSDRRAIIGKDAEVGDEGSGPGEQRC